ncbi:MAG: VacJ family lipoprotein [Hyphomonadaceae bacterium]|nr:VacJ family lipoprotein [Hyphomonadaceae bacterium]
MRRHWLIAALVLGTGGVAQAQEAAPAPPPVAPQDVGQADPFEGFNRAMFAFNARVDEFALEPVARGYRAVTPKFFRTGVSNVLSNLTAPVTFANDVLQVEPTRAGTTLARFGINSTIGVVGLFDVASGMGLEKHSEDFGQTLGRWGVAPGPYIVLPLLGPSTLRDGSGRIVDGFLDPINYAEFDGDDAFRITRGVLTVVSAREAGIEAFESLFATSVDPYVSLRTTYLILRESAVQNGRTNVQDLPEFDEIPDEAGQEPSPAPAQPPPQGN